MRNIREISLNLPDIILRETDGHEGKVFQYQSKKMFWEYSQYTGHMNKLACESLSMFQAMRNTCMISDAIFDWGK